MRAHTFSLQMTVLDAGCGTGNYALGLLDAGLGHITMMDGSDGMLNAARAKMANYKDNTEYRLGSLPQLPFADESFDVVMFNQVWRLTGLFRIVLSNVKHTWWIVQVEFCVAL